MNQGITTIFPKLARFSRRSKLLMICCIFTLSGCDQPSKESDGSKPVSSPGDSEIVAVEGVRGEFLEVANQLEQSENKFLGTMQLEKLRAAGENSFDSLTRVNIQFETAWHLLRLGKVEEAIKELDAVYEMRNELTAGYPLQKIQVLRALAYVRLAEVENCVKQHNCDCCIFPLSNGGVHAKRGPAEVARNLLLDILKNAPDELTSVWLLNVVSMALGEYPDGVPEQYRIPVTAFDSEFDIKRFRDIATETGVDTFNLCGGAILEDFDGDRLLDILTSTYDPRGPLTFYRNQGDGNFEDISSAAGLNGQLGGLNCLSADYDGDGDSDILVLRGAWLGVEGQIRNSLLRNKGDGTFEDITKKAGLAVPAYPTQAAVWGDFNNDSHLDLFIGNEGNQSYFPSQLFMNQGDGTFLDEAVRAGVTNDRLAKGVTAGDFDNDGDLDIYVSNIGENRLYENNGDATFVDIAPRLGLVEPKVRSFATWFFDYDNDGWLDLFVAAYEAKVHNLADHYLGNPHGTERPRLYRNAGDGTFEEVGVNAGLDFPSAPMGANFGDLDNDGFLDIYLATGEPAFQALMPNVMLRNDAGKKFQNVTTSGGFGHLQKGHGVAFGDIDNDGDQDIYHQLGGFFPGDKFQNVLFENPGHDNHFVTIKLIGTTSHRSGVGARIQVILSTDDGSRSVHRAVGSVSSFGGSPVRQEIGLGNATAIERIEIKWPRSEEVQTVTSVPLDSSIEVTEGNGHREVEVTEFQFAR